MRANRLQRRNFFTLVKFTNVPSDLGNFRVLAAQKLSLQVPYAKADGDATFATYHVNVAINSQVFAANP